MLRAVSDAAMDALGPARAPPIGDRPLDRVLVVRFGGIGDVVATTALVATLRRERPAASVTVVTSPPSEAVLAGHPAIDVVVAGPEITAGPRFAGLVPAWRRMRALSRVPWDAAFLTHGDVYRLAPALALRARWKIGFDYGGRGRGTGLTHAVAVFDRRDARHRPPARPTLAETMVDLLRALLGRDVAAAPARIHLAPEEHAQAAARLSALGLRAPFVAMAPGATLPVKRWPADAFAAVAHRLARSGIATLVVGAGDDRAVAATVTAAAPDARSVAGTLPLRDSLALLAAASVVVGGDTGLVHAGAALGRPTVALFGPTDPYVYGQAGPGHAILTADLACRPCDRMECAIAPEAAVPPCLAAVGPEAVAAAVEAVVAAQG
ncbi:MAG: glycosyltransferase family 9 protein [Alphaproteobacteria bacterium]